VDAVTESPRRFDAWVRIIGAWVLATALAAPALGQGASAPEHVVKAAFLYKFLNYAEWPPTAFAGSDSPYVIGVLGSDDVASELSQIAADRTVGGRRVQVRRVKRGESLAGLHVLFVGAGESKELPALARQATALLLVSEDPRPGKPDSAINLVIDQGKVRFDVALDVADRAGVRLSSRLLGVARSVRPAGDQ
jgi:hypothetical protein